MNESRYIIEGEWSGYNSGQLRVVHRTVHTDPALRAWAEKTCAIYYTDGTSLDLSVRELPSSEQVQEKHGYDDLIRDCYRQGVSSVSALVNNDSPVALVDGPSPTEET